MAIPAAGDRWLILDAGTGLARLASVLDGRPLRASILLSHLHWDHTHGLPFLLNADRDDAELDVLLPAQPDGSSAIDVMARAMSPPHFPLTPDGLQGTWRYRSVDAGPFDVEGFAVTAADIAHRGGRTFGYRVEHETGSLAYLPDHGLGIATPSTGPPPRSSCGASTCCCTAPGTSRRNGPSPTSTATPPSTTPSRWRRSATSGDSCSSTTPLGARTPRSPPSSSNYRPARSRSRSAAKGLWVETRA